MIFWAVAGPTPSSVSSCSSVAELRLTGVPGAVPASVAPAAAGAPPTLPFGVKMVGPVIYTFGDDAQRERFLPGIRSSDVQPRKSKLSQGL